MAPGQLTPSNMTLPKLPARATYLHLSNAAKRNALSLSVLRQLRSQLHAFNTSPSGRLLILPPFKPEILSAIEAHDEEHIWLLDASVWRRERKDLPNVIVLRSEGPVFSSGHDLMEIKRLSHDEVKETFALCAEVMSLIRRSPALVVCPIQALLVLALISRALPGLATAAGFQLAMSTDYPIALADTPFRLPGASIGLPCTSPSTAVSRRLPPSLAYRLLATAETVTAAELQGAVDVVPVPEDAKATDTTRAFGDRVEVVVRRLADETAGQPQALGKWAFWTQAGMRDGGGYGYEAAAAWAGRVMALHTRSEDAKEGIDAFFGKRKAVWKT
ncbi:hypothetical protein FGG08_007054 [Glutinoglossum americanum]|uniref:Enoyl-CoA hydratase domain-containing protein 3, mitochondrial n=1 Tax=Glutinoglossum americanum TaxID=1670608 RepID=A0A9P8HX29_9PEZI|nr:hypothetical protein FGG08_007054 [Glutinoglossum americanum]